MRGARCSPASWREIEICLQQQHPCQACADRISSWLSHFSLYVLDPYLGFTPHQPWLGPYRHLCYTPSLQECFTQG